MNCSHSAVPACFSCRFKMEVPELEAEIVELKASNAALLKRVELMRNALGCAIEWMSLDGCDCGVDEPGSCALCLCKEALDPIGKAGHE